MCSGWGFFSEGGKEAPIRRFPEVEKWKDK
jgi:hypothetical protein